MFQAIEALIAFFDCVACGADGDRQLLQKSSGEVLWVRRAQITPRIAWTYSWQIPYVILWKDLVSLRNTRDEANHQRGEGPWGGGLLAAWPGVKDSCTIPGTQGTWTFCVLSFYVPFLLPIHEINPGILSETPICSYFCLLAVLAECSHFCLRAF